MRVVLTALQYHPDYPGGANRLAYDEALYLAGKGHDVWYVAQDMARRGPEYAEDAGLHVLRYPAPALGPLSPRKLTVHQAATADLLARYVPEADVIHGHAPLQHDGALSFYGRSVRSCYSMHSPVRLELEAGTRGASLPRRLLAQIAGRSAGLIERRCLRDSDCATAFSEYTRSLVEDLHGRDLARRMVVVPGWVDLRRYRCAEDRAILKDSLGWPKRPTVLFTLRRLVPRMGLDALLRAVHMARGRGADIYLVIGGAGPLRAALEALADELGMKGAVRFEGRVPDDRLPSMYAAADAFVLPTATLECFGLITLEALACGRPVLATPVGAIPEVLSGFEPAWLARDSSAEAIADLVTAFARGILPQHDPETLRARVQQLYASERVLSQLTALVLGDAPTETGAAVCESA